MRESNDETEVEPSPSKIACSIHKVTVDSRHEFAIFGTAYLLANDEMDAVAVPSM